MSSPRSPERHPQDPDAFEAGYRDQLALGAKVPGIDRLESSKVWPKDDGTPAPAYWLLDLYFTDYDTARDAVATVAAGAFFRSVIALATGGIRIVFADIEESRGGRAHPTIEAAVRAP